MVDLVEQFDERLNLCSSVPAHKFESDASTSSRFEVSVPSMVYRLQLYRPAWRVKRWILSQRKQ